MTFSAREIFLILVPILSCFLIIPIWITQTKDSRRHYALSFLFGWLMFGSLLDVLSQILLRHETFPFFLFHPNGTSLDAKARRLITSQSLPLFALDPTANTSLEEANLPHSGSLSGLTAMVLIASITGTVPGSKQHTPQMLTCIFFAHLSEIRWLATSIVLLQWSFYLHQCLIRKLGVVNPRLMATIAANEASSRGHTPGEAVESDFAAGFTFRRSVRSLPDIWLMLPVFILAPIALVGVMVQSGVKQCFGCLRPKDSVPGMERAHREALEAWSKRLAPTDADLPSEDVGETRERKIPGNKTAVVPDAVERAAAQPGSFTIDLIRPSPSLAAKLHVEQVDLNEIQEESYSYDIMGDKIRYHKNSWTHKLKRSIDAHPQLVKDILVCLILPTLAFMLLFFIEEKDRSYEVYSDRGGCRVSRSLGYGDWVRVLLLELTTTATSVFGLIFGFLALHEFRKQNGTLSIDIKNLCPSPDVLRLYKSARVVKYCIILCLSLNTILCLSCVVSLALYGFHFSVVYQIPSSTSTADGNGLSVSDSDTVGPLFRLAQQDRDAYHPAITFILVLVSFIFLLWSRLRGLKRAIQRYLRPEEFEEQASAEDISVFPFPSSYMQSPEFLVSNSKEETKAGRDSNADERDRNPLERIGGEHYLKTGFASNDHTIRTSHWDIETGLHSERLLGSNQCWSKTSPAIDTRSSVHISDSGLYGLPDDHLEGAGVGSKSDESRTAAPVRAHQFPAALTAYRERYSSSWLPSAPVHGHPLPRSSHGGKMMGQYLQLSRQTPSLSKLCLDISPQPASMLPEADHRFVYIPISRQVATDYTSRTSKMERNNTPSPMTFASPKSALEMSGSITSTSSRATTAKSENESPESDSLTLDQKYGPYTMTPRASYSGRGSNSASYSSYRRSISSSSLQRSKPDSQRRIDPSTEQRVDEEGRVNRARLSAVQMERYGDPHLSDVHNIEHGGDQGDGHLHTSECAAGYDQFLEKLATAKRRAYPTKTKNTALFPSPSQANRDSNAGDYGGDEHYEVETMGATSLEELVDDNEISKHASIRHTVMSGDDSKMIEVLVLQAVQSFDTPVAADLPSLRRGHVCRSTGGRGRRQPSMVQCSASGPNQSCSDQQCGRSHDHSAISYLQIISIDGGQPRPDSDFFYEDEVTFNWRVSTSPDRDESALREISMATAQEVQDHSERLGYNAGVPSESEPNNLHLYGRHMFDFHRGYSELVRSASSLSEPTGTSARRHSSSHLPTGLQAGVTPMGVGEPRIYSAQLDRMIALPRGVPPTKAQPIRLRKAHSVRQLNASMEDRAILEQLLVMGPLPPAPSAVPPPTPPAL